jgi:hypothetical protein
MCRPLTLCANGTFCAKPLTGRKHLSFASKFAHFFIDMERFPIYDSYAVKMVAYYLGRQGQVTNTAHPYKAFVENINRLKERAHLSCTSKKLDRYLWLAGLYQTWLRNPASQINAEVAQLFRSQSSEVATELTILLPEATSIPS